MSDDDTWRTFLDRRAHGPREPLAPTVITDERRLEAWEWAVENIERLLRRQDGTAED